jgi:F420-non-reducing hydrogenase small subunit
MRRILQPRFAVLQLSGCAGCEVSLINASEWVDQYQLVYMPLVVSTHTVPEDTEVLLVSGGVRNDEDVYNLRRAAQIVKRVVAVGTCAISGGVANLGDRDEVRAMFMAQENRHHLPRLLPKSHPIDAFVDVDLYLPGCPPTPELFMAALIDPENFKASGMCAANAAARNLKDMRPKHLLGFQQGEVLPDICLINQGYLCVWVRPCAADAAPSAPARAIPVWAAGDHPMPISKRNPRSGLTGCRASLNG